MERSRFKPCTSMHTEVIEARVSGSAPLTSDSGVRSFTVGCVWGYCRFIVFVMSVFDDICFDLVPMMTRMAVATANTMMQVMISVTAMMVVVGMVIVTILTSSRDIGDLDEAACEIVAAVSHLLCFQCSRKKNTRSEEFAIASRIQCRAVICSAVRYLLH